VKETCDLYLNSLVWLNGAGVWSKILEPYSFSYRR
jgi:hypothetical protein